MGFKGFSLIGLFHWHNSKKKTTTKKTKPNEAFGTGELGGGRGHMVDVASSSPRTVKLVKVKTEP